MRKLIRQIFIAAALIVPLALHPAAASELEPGEFAPLSPEFLRWQAEHERQQTYSVPADNKSSISNPTGYIPIPVDLSHLADNPPREVASPVADNKANILPVSFDLRNVNGKSYVTSVKDQSPYDTCWTFASLGAMESNYLMQGKPEIDLSEMHLAWYAFKNADKSLAFHNMVNDSFETVMAHGGNSFYPTALYSRLAGPVNEQTVPYNDQAFAPAPEDYQRVLRIRDVFYLVMGDNKTNINAKADARNIVKQRIIENGAVVGNYNSNNSSYHKSTSGSSNYYYKTSSTTTNHAVQIVGWDDNYPASNFKTTPKSNGAWLIKNSWGDQWWNGSSYVGDNGYFWMSYEQFISEGSAFVVEPVNASMKAYYYDALGWCGSFGWKNQKQVYAANVFKSERDNESMIEAGFYMPDNNLSYELRVYTGLGTSMPSSPIPSGSTLEATVTGTIPYAGYHTITLDAPVALVKDEYFSVVLKITGTGMAPVEQKVSSFSANAVAEPGSFFSSNGTSWEEGTKNSVNACVKAFTVNDSNATQIAPAMRTSNLYDGVTGVKYSAVLSATGTRPLTWSVSGTLPPGLSINASTGEISGTPTTEGTYTFTVTAANSLGSSNKDFTITIHLLPTLATTELTGYTGYSFNRNLELSMSVEAKWKASGKLPAGLKLNASTGAITGKPTKSGTYTVAFTASTSTGDVTGDVVFTINPKPVKPKINTTSLPAGTVDIAYSQALSYSGTDPVTLSIDGIPNGLTFNPSTGNLSGTPLTAGIFTMKITAENTATQLDGKPVTKNVKLTIKAQPPKIAAPGDLKDAVVGEEYSAVKFTLSEGTQPVTWSVSGLPQGITLSSDGTISGTPKGNAKIYKITLKAKNAGGTDTLKTSLNVLMKPELSVNKLAAGTTDKKYSVKLTTKGSTPISWDITGLPDTLTFQPDRTGASATITGTPLEADTYSLRIVLRNAGGITDTSLDLSVKGVAPKLTASLAKGKADKEYTGSKIKAEGTKPIEIAYSISEADKAKFGIEKLEDLGLVFSADYNKGTAQITGTPVKSIKSLPITISADSYVASNPVTKKLSLTITGTKPAFILPSAKTLTITQEAGKEIDSIDFEVTGTPDITFTMSTANGFKLTPNGKTAVLTGIATDKDGKTTITVTASNTEGKATKKITIQTMTPPTITTASLKDGKLKKSYSEKVAATGTKNITWKIAGDLPDGVKFSKGAFSGTPKTAGNFPITITASNGIGEDTKSFTISIEGTENSTAPVMAENSSVLENVSAQAPVMLEPEQEEQEIDSEPEIMLGSEREADSLGDRELAELEEGGYAVAAVLPEITVTQNGLYDLEVTLEEGTEAGAKLYWFAFPQDAEESEDDSIVEFYDTAGAEIENVPEDNVIVVSAWFREGVKYAPVIAVKK